MSEAAVLRLVISLVFIVALVLACAWIMRRSGWLRSGAATGLRVIGSHRLGARNYLAVIEVEDARLVVGVTANQISLLHTLPPADPATAGLSPSGVLAQEETRPGFAAALGKALKGR